VLHYSNSSAGVTKLDSLKILGDHCIGTTESEKQFLKEVFVDSGKCKDILRKAINNPVVLIGKKGSGKSAMFFNLPIIANNIGLDSLLIKPDDIILKNIRGDSVSIGDVKRESYNALLFSIAAKIGSRFDGMLSATQKTLRDTAVKAGQKDKDSIEKLAKFLSVLGKPLSQLDLHQLLPENKDVHHKEVERKVASHLKSNDKAFLLLIDDTDQIVPGYIASEISKIWGFLSAVRKISEEIPNIKCVVSLRTEVWRALCQSKGQRDQVDHFRPLKFDLDVPDEEIKEILSRRFEFVANKLDLHAKHPINCFFKGETTKLPTSNEHRLWLDYLVKSARSRPRDAIQLCKTFTDLAVEQGRSIIDESMTDKVALIYSEEKIEDVEAEFQNECTNVKPILRTFSEVGFDISADEIRAHLLKVPSKCSVIIRGETVANDKPDSVFILWKFLHEIGFLNARVPDSRESRDFRHINYDDDQNFVSKGNWTDMQKCTWEVHPAYRSHLLKLKTDERSRVLGKQIRKGK